MHAIGVNNVEVIPVSVSWRLLLRSLEDSILIFVSGRFVATVRNRLDMILTGYLQLGCVVLPKGSMFTQVMTAGGLGTCTIVSRLGWAWTGLEAQRAFLGVSGSSSYRLAVDPASELGVQEPMDF